MGLLAQYLFVRELIGLNLIAAVLGCAVLARLARSRPRSRTDILLLGAAAFAAFGAVRTEAAVQTFDAIAATALLIAWLVPLDALADAVTSRAARALSAAMPAARERVPASRRPLQYAAGSALAIPFLVVFVALFSSADAVFERSVRDVVDLAWLRELTRDLPARIVVAVAVGWCATGAFTVAALANDTRERNAALVSHHTAVAFLIAIDALFAV